MKKHYQIFISSTYADLKEERDKVMRAIVQLKCFPVGMDFFPAIDTAQFDYIKSAIDECDYYILIIGDRYGSMAEDGVSYTEKEFDYAVSKGIPVLAFIKSDINTPPLAKIDVDAELQKKLERFKHKVLSGRLVSFWRNADDLKARVITSLIEVFEEQPQIGWVRGDIASSGDSKEEIYRLKKEITEYENRIKKLEADLEKKDEDCHALELSLENAQPEMTSLKEQIKTLKKQIKALETELEKYKTSSVSNETELQPQTETFTVRGVSFKMIRVEGGTFMMGENDDDDNENNTEEHSVHKVTLSDYWIGETQVTQALWEVVMGDNPSEFKGESQRPVEHVSWVKCTDFFHELNKLTGKRFRLPTEAQWEFAARGGKLGKDKHNRFAGSNNICDVAWFNGNSMDKTHPVGELDANELGLYDMSGNVLEWCLDWYAPYKGKAQIDPETPFNGYNLVILRGGSWRDEPGDCWVSKRVLIPPSDISVTYGLRLALKIDH